MASCRVTVRTSDGARQWEVDDWTALVLIAAVSAEPETLDEFFAAVERYQPEHRWAETGREPADVADAATEGGPWCLIDLVGRTLVAGGTFELPDPVGAYQPDDEEQVEGFPIVWLDTPADWAFLEADGLWLDRVAERADAARQRPQVDIRRVLFGRPLLDFLAERVLAEADQEGVLDEARLLELTRAIHAEWLMTPREGLDGRTPRQWLLSDRGRITRDIEHRSHQWAQQGYAAPPLARDSVAYRFGPFGTAEVVLYFDLVRSLLAAAWELVERQPGVAKDVLVERLADHRDRWLQAPCEDGGPQTPAELIEAERCRMPVTSDATHLDCDCPICQEMASGQFGPMFMCFDGYHLEMEDEFAFSMTEGREEWELEQEGDSAFVATMDKSKDEGVLETASDEQDAESVWSSSFVDWESVLGTDAAPELMKSAIGYPLAEVVCDLKERHDGRPHLDTLNEAFASLRTAVDPVAVRSAAEQLRDELEEVAQAYPDLVAKSADLQSHLDEVLRHLA